MYFEHKCMHFIIYHRSSCSKASVCKAAGAVRVHVNEVEGYDYCTFLLAVNQCTVYADRLHLLVLNFTWLHYMYVKLKNIITMTSTAH